MLTSRYLLSTKNLSAILKKIVDGVAPEKFTTDHLKAIGFASSQDRAIIPLLKDLGFLASDGTPTSRYHAYRDQSKSRAVMAEALREAYEDVFHIREVPTESDRGAVEGLFKTKTNASDRVAQLQAMTFYGLLALADMKSASPASPTLPEVVKREPPTEVVAPRPDPKESRTMGAELHYTIQIHLPATKDIEVFNAIFRSLRDNLLA